MHTAKTTEKEKAVLLGFICLCIFVLVCATVYSIKTYQQEEAFDIHSSTDYTDYYSGPDDNIASDQQQEAALDTEELN